MTGDDSLGSEVSEPELRQLARALSAVLGQLHALAAETAQAPLADRLADHLGVDARVVPVLSHEFPQYQLLGAPAGRRGPWQM